MKKLTLLFLILFGSLSAKSQFDSASVYKSFAASFIYNDSMYLFKPNLQLTKDSIHKQPHDSSLIHILINAFSTTTIYEVKNDGTLNLFGNGATSSHSTYKVIYEYSQTQPVKKPVIPGNEDSAGDKNILCVGISVRMIATLYTYKGSLDLSKIASFISASGERKKLSGFLEVKVSGIESKTITSLIPTPTSISPESIINALQAMAAIKSHFNDNDVRIIPQLVGYYYLKDRNEKKLFNQLPASFQ